MASRTSEIFRIAARLIVGAAFIVGSASKMLLMPGLHTVYYHLVGKHPILHYGFCALEFLMGLWFLSSWQPRRAAAIGIVVFSFFLGTLSMELARKHPRPCGCGILPSRSADGEGIRRNLAIGLAINAVLLSGCVAMTREPKKDPCAAKD